MLSWVTAFADVKLPVLKYMPTKFVAFSVYSAKGCTPYGRFKFVWWPPNIRGLFVWLLLCITLWRQDF